MDYPSWQSSRERIGEFTPRSPWESPLYQLLYEYRQELEYRWDEFVLEQKKSSLLACLYLLPASFVCRTVVSETDGDKLNLALANTAKLLVVYGVLYCLGGFFVLA